MITIKLLYRHNKHVINASKELEYNVQIDLDELMMNLSVQEIVNSFKYQIQDNIPKGYSLKGVTKLIVDHSAPFEGLVIDEEYIVKNSELKLIYKNGGTENTKTNSMKSIW